MNLIKINYKNKIIRKFIMNGFVPLIQSLLLSLILVASSIYGTEMECEEGELSLGGRHSQSFEELPAELLLVTFNFLDQGRLLPHELFSPIQINICPIPINDFIATGMVCHKWRDTNLSMRENRILSIPDTKKLISLEDYEAIQNSKYITLCMFSMCVLPEKISYLDCLNRIEIAAFLPPKGTRAYTYDHPNLDVTKGRVLLAQEVKRLLEEKRWEEKRLSEEKYFRSDVIQNIYRLKNLRILSLNGNNLDADALRSIPQLTNLSDLDLSYNNPGDEFLLSLTCLKNLKTLKILRMQIHDSKVLRLAFSEALPRCLMPTFG